MWGRAAVAGLVVFLVTSVTAYYFGSVHEELFDRSTGRIIDCGTIFAVNDLPIAVDNCDGAFSTDTLGFALMAALVLSSFSVMVYGSIREYRGSGRR